MKKQKKQMSEKWLPVIGVGVVILAVLLIAGQKLHDPEERKQQQEAKQQPEESYRPEDCVELGKYTGIEMSLVVTEEELQEEIKSVLEEYATYEQKEGFVQEGDQIYAGVEGYVGGQPVASESVFGEDYIEIGSGEWPEGFEDALIGAATGQTAVFTLPVPDGTYGDPQLDGKEVEFHVTVQYICGKEILPEYTDDFVRSLSKKYKTTEEHTAFLKKKIKKENEEQKAEYTWSEVVENSKVTKYPKQLMKDCKEEVLQGYYDMAEVYGTTKEEVFAAFGYEDEQDFIDRDLKALAKETAKEYLLARAIADKEGISYTKEEYEKKKDEEYGFAKDSYDSAEAFEQAKRSYLENQTILSVVKEWVSEKAKYTR